MMAATSARLHILAIHAHPDDVEFQCAGTLIRLRELGHRITIATMTPGDLGSATMSSEETARVRRHEGQNAANILGGEYFCLEFRDLSICFDDASRRRVTEFFRRIRPDIVLTAPPVDYMHDHEFTSMLVRDACFNCTVPLYKTRQWDPAEPCERIPYLYYVDAVEGTDHSGNRHPVDFTVDVTDQFQAKLEALACHASQRDWLKQQHGVDEYLDACRRWSQERGRDIGVTHGEGFRQYRGHPHPTDNRLLELLESSDSSAD